MKKTFIYIALFGLAAATACRRSEIQRDEERRTIQLEIARAPFDEPDSLQRASKATETAFEPLDSIGVYVHTSAALAATGNHTPNLLFSTSDGSTWTPGGHLSDVPQGGKTYTATGYYPYDRLLVDPTAFVFSVAGDQTTAKAVTQSDLMYAAPTAITNPTSAPALALTFKHLFSKISVKFAVPPSIDGAAVQQVARVDLRGVYRAAKVNLANGSFASLDNQGDITMCLTSGNAATAGSEVVYEAIAIPQTIKKGDLLVELTFATDGGPRSFTYRPTADEVWATNLKRNLHLVSVGDLCFASYLDLTDGLAHTALELKIKATTGANWTLSSPAAWLTLCDTPNGTYAAAISGTGTGAEQSVYVAVTANTSAVGGAWLARTAALSLTSGSITTRYTAAQNYYRFGPGEALWNVEAMQSVQAVAPFVSNQEWKAVGSADWIKVSPSALWGEGNPVQEYAGGGSVGSNGLFVHLEANNTATARTGTLTITPATVGGTATTTTIKQSLATCAVSPRAAEVSKYASTATPLFTVTVPKGVRWKLVSASAGGSGNMNLSVVPAVGAEQVGTGEPQQVVGSYAELTGDAVRWSDVVVAWASYGNDQQTTVRVTQNLEAVLLDNVWWATGNLVATGARGAAGKGGCAIGAPTDGGLYFQFGGLIGYKGGNQANGGTGVGLPQSPLTTNGTYWNGSGYSWASDAMVWPTELVGTKTNWTNTTGSSISTLSDYYFNYSVAPWEASGQNIRDFAVSISGDSGSGTLSTGRYAKKGVGDPCTYYLGGSWRLPTTNEFVSLCNNQGGSNWVPWATAGGSWTTSPTYGGNFSSNRLFFPASGYRSLSNGSFHTVTTHGSYWGSSVNGATGGYHLTFNQPNGVVPQNSSLRSGGFPVRCVADFVDTKAWTAPIAGGTKTVKVFVPKGQSWTASVVKGGAGLTLAGGSGAGAGSFTLTYPSAGAGSSRGAIVRVTSGSNTYDLPITQSEVAITAGNALWAKGNLIATGAQGAAGKGGCKIGAPTDNGLYFQFGSLIGWKGGTPANGGNGVGRSGQANYKFWDGAAAWSWENDAYLWPTEMGANHPTECPSNDGKVAGDRTSFDYYFNYNAPPYSTPGQSIRGFNVPMAGDTGSGTLATGRYAKFGVGDPCTYYLGAPWRLPTTEEQLALMGGKTSNTWIPWATAGVTGRWATASETFGGVSGTGAWFGAGLAAGAGTPDPAINLFFTCGGGRSAGYNGALNNASTDSGDGLYLSCSVGGVSTYSQSYYHYLYGIRPQGLVARATAISVRCVMDL